MTIVKYLKNYIGFENHTNNNYQAKYNIINLREKILER